MSNRHSSLGSGLAAGWLWTTVAWLPTVANPSHRLSRCGPPRRPTHQAQSGAKPG